MGDPYIRPSNVAMLFKLETTEDVDAAPVAADAFPFEEDGYSYNSPYRSEASREANGSMVAGAPMVIGQPAQLSIRFRMKGAGPGVTYSASVKPPHHALLSAAGKRGLFTAPIAAAALTAGTTTSASLGTGFASTAQAYRGMPLVLSGAGAPGTGQTPFITDYSAAKLASLTDLMGTALSTLTQAAIPANWTYAGTSPKSSAARATDHPSGTLYIYEDGTLLKFTGVRFRVSDWGGDSARPGFMTLEGSGTFRGKTDAAIPSDIVIPGHAAPTLVMGPSGVNLALSVNRRGLPAQNWAIGEETEMESPDDPNTPMGFAAAQLGERSPMLRINPLATLVAVRNILADIEAGSIYPAVLRSSGPAGNRWAITKPTLTPVQADPGTRGIHRSEDQQYRLLNPGVDAQGRDGESILCFY
jgi:hypothetical protein